MRARWTRKLEVSQPSRYGHEGLSSPVQQGVRARVEWVVFCPQQWLLQVHLQTGWKWDWHW